VGNPESPWRPPPESAQTFWRPRVARESVERSTLSFSRSTQFETRSLRLGFVDSNTAAGGRTETETKRAYFCALSRQRLGPIRGPRARLPRQPSGAHTTDATRRPRRRRANPTVRFDCARIARLEHVPQQQKTAGRVVSFFSRVSLSLSLLVGPVLCVLRERRERVWIRSRPRMRAARAHSLYRERERVDRLLREEENNLSLSLSLSLSLLRQGERKRLSFRWRFIIISLSFGREREREAASVSATERLSRSCRTSVGYSRRASFERRSNF
jgi:hypothetical protein